MSRVEKTSLFQFVCCFIFAFFVLTPLYADNDDILNRIVKLNKSKGCVYDLLEDLSKQIGYCFIYDSDLIKSEWKVTLKKKQTTVGQAIHEIVKNNRILISVIGHNILIGHANSTVASKPDSVPEVTRKPQYITLQGTLLDKYSKEPIEYCTVEIVNTSITGVTNQEGKFRMTIPDSLSHHRMRFSQLGYSSQEIKVSHFNNRSLTIFLLPKLFPIKEFIVRPSDPMKLLKAVMDSRIDNYQESPVYMTSFYREGIEKGKKLVGLTEAVFKIYKTPSHSFLSDDQVKLLKMRTIKNSEEKDSIVTKIESGIGACLQLDILKELPDFMIPDQCYDIYDYKPSETILLDERQVNLVSFKQKKKIKEPLYCGKLYIDSENNALVRADYEIAPKYITKMSGLLVKRKSRHIKVIPQKMEYTVHYKRWNNKYYLNYARGDLYFKIRKRNSLIGSKSVHAWFEIVTCEIDDKRVKRFTRKEMLPTSTVFSDMQFIYDDRFWGNFNVIPIEEKLYKAIRVISEKINEVKVVN